MSYESELPKGEPRNEPAAEEIEPLMGLSPEDISRLVLWLLVEEALRGRLAVFRPKNLPTKPTEGKGELLVRRLDVVPVGDAPR